MKPLSSLEMRSSTVKLAVKNDQSGYQVAEELGINSNTLHTWLSKYHTYQKPKASQVQDKHRYEELKRLRRNV